ncbi:hypothetical protein K3495_g2550 [Podosphaera aphanis]|nr:hypothetical protein K3495_g2550 [Podosphaera aphanis]
MPLLSKKARIAAAVKDFQEGKFPSKRRAAQANDIDHKTLAANLVAPTGKSGGHNKVLKDAQEEALREYCDRCILMNINPKLNDFRRAANSLFRLDRSGKRVSHMFATRFTDYINGRIIDDTFNDIPLTPFVRRAFLKREKAIQAMLLSGGLAEQELIERSEKEREKKGAKYANRVVQKYGVLEAGAARLRIAERNKWEESQAVINSKRREEVEIKRMQKWYRAITTGGPHKCRFA